MHLLDVDPITRYTAKQALQSKWIKSTDERELEKRNLRNSLDGISRESRRLKGMVKTVQWMNSAKKNLSSLTGGSSGAPNLSSLTANGAPDVSLLS